MKMPRPLSHLRVVPACIKRIEIASIVLFGITAAHSQTEPTSRIEGNVADTSGGRVQNAAVSLESKGLVILRTSADENGHFEIEAHRGDYTLRVTYPGFRNYELAVHLTEVDINNDLVLQIAGTCSPCVTVGEPPIEPLNASLKSTLPLNPLPPLKLHNRNWPLR